MKIVIAAIFLFVLATVGFGLRYGGLGSGASFEVDTKIKNQRTFNMPDVEFKNLKGESVKLSAFKGKIILLNFWASWCGPCAEEFPAMLELSETFKDDMVFVAVSNDEELSDVNKFINLFKEKHNKQLNAENVFILRDKSLEVTQNYFNVVRLPETFIVNKEGLMVKKVIGVIDWAGKEIHDFIAKLK